MSEVIAASIAGLIAVIIALLGARQETKRQTDQLRRDVESERQAFESAMKLQQERLSAELRTEFMAEAAIRGFLSKAQKKRSFVAIRNRIGGFKDDDLRQLLVRSGAVRFWNRRVSPPRELWGLRDLNEEEARLDDETSPNPTPGDRS